MKNKTILAAALLALALLGLTAAHFMLPPSPQSISLVTGRNVEHLTVVTLTKATVHRPLSTTRLLIYAALATAALALSFYGWLNRFPQRVLATGWHTFAGSVASCRQVVSENRGMLTFFILVGTAGWSGLLLATNHGVTATFHCFVASCALIAIQLAKAVAHRRGAGLLSIVIGFVLLLAGSRLLECRSAQIDKYNQALLALDAQHLDEAIKLLDESSRDYQEKLGRSQLCRFIFGDPSTKVEARAQFHKGVALFLQDPKKNARAAALQYWKSLRLVPGNQYAGLSSDEAGERADDALHAKFNLEVAENQGGGGGKAKGKQGDQQGKEQQPGDNQLNDPSKAAGKQSNDTL